MFDNLEPISTYTADQAIDDGVLVVAAPEQFGSKLLVTRAVFKAFPTTTVHEGMSVVMPNLRFILWHCRFPRTLVQFF